MNKRGPGRPPLGKLKRSQLVAVRLSPAEVRAWSAAAELDGLPISKWLRAAAELAIARGSTR